MKPLINTLMLAGLLSGFAGALQAHPMTERYIPLGYSPGVSGEYSMLGAVRSIAADGRSLLVEMNGGERRVPISAETRIWLDRTPMQQSNRRGDSSDLKPGRQVEVRFERKDYAGKVYWIKVQITGDGS